MAPARRARGTERRKEDREGAAKNDCETTAKITSCTAPVHRSLSLSLSLWEVGRKKHTRCGRGRVAKVAHEKTKDDRSIDERSSLFDKGDSVSVCSLHFLPSHSCRSRGIVWAFHFSDWRSRHPPARPPVAKNKGGRRRRGRYQGEISYGPVEGRRAGGSAARKRGRERSGGAAKRPIKEKMDRRSAAAAPETAMRNWIAPQPYTEYRTNRTKRRTKRACCCTGSQ